MKKPLSRPWNDWIAYCRLLPAGQHCWKNIDSRRRNTCAALQRLHVLQQRVPLTLAETGAVRVALVGIAGLGCIKQKGAIHVFSGQSNVIRVKVAATHVKRSHSLSWRF